MGLKSDIISLSVCSMFRVVVQEFRFHGGLPQCSFLAKGYSSELIHLSEEERDLIDGNLFWNADMRGNKVGEPDASGIIYMFCQVRCKIVCSA